MDTIVNVEVCVPQTIYIDLEKLYEKILKEARGCENSNWKSLSDFDKAEYIKEKACNNMDYYLNKIGISEEITGYIIDEDIEYISDQLDLLIDKKLC